MADKTHHEEELSRQEVAEYFRSLSVELAEDDSPWSIEVGNKQVTLHPRERIHVETTVSERSRMLGDDVETVQFELSWKSRSGGEK